MPDCIQFNEIEKRLNQRIKLFSRRTDLKAVSPLPGESPKWSYYQETYQIQYSDVRIDRLEVDVIHGTCLAVDGGSQPCAFSRRNLEYGTPALFSCPYDFPPVPCYWTRPSDKPLRKAFPKLERIHFVKLSKRDIAEILDMVQYWQRRGWKIRETGEFAEARRTGRAPDWVELVMEKSLLKLVVRIRHVARFQSSLLSIIPLGDWRMWVDDGSSNRREMTTVSRGSFPTLKEAIIKAEAAIDFIVERNAHVQTC